MLMFTTEALLLKNDFPFFRGGDLLRGLVGVALQLVNLIGLRLILFSFFIVFNNSSLLLPVGTLQDPWTEWF